MAWRQAFGSRGGIAVRQQCARRQHAHQCQKMGLVIAQHASTLAGAATAAAAVAAAGQGRVQNKPLKQSTCRLVRNMLTW